jgi:hypothetical protein
MAAGTTTPAQRRPPKMHLFAADKKPSKSPPKDEEFPDVPVEWLVGSPSSLGSSLTPSDSVSSVSMSEVHSGDNSEDEMDCAYREDRMNISPPISHATCHILSVGLKALLKVQA